MLKRMSVYEQKKTFCFSTFRESEFWVTGGAVKSTLPSVGGTGNSFTTRHNLSHKKLSHRTRIMPQRSSCLCFHRGFMHSENREHFANLDSVPWWHDSDEHLPWFSQLCWNGRGWGVTQQSREQVWVSTTSTSGFLWLVQRTPPPNILLCAHCQDSVTKPVFRIFFSNTFLVKSQGAYTLSKHIMLTKCA